MKRHYSFLFKRGAHIVYTISLIGFLINGMLAVSYLRNDQWLLCIWSLGAIALLPKAILGIILLLGRDDLVYVNMPLIIHRVFARTMHKYGEESLAPFVRKVLLAGFINEIALLFVALIPLLVYITQNR